jgi:phage host-nuclease inhibitor protein Gam
VSELEDAQETERALREQIGDLVRARARAESEARRLAERAARPDADATLGDIVARYRAQAERLDSEIEALRTALREHEADLERLRAEDAGT